MNPRQFSVITRLSLLLTTLAAVIMLVLMMVVDDALKQFRQDAIAADQAYIAQAMRAQLGQDTRMLLQALGDNLEQEIRTRDRHAIEQVFNRLGNTRQLLYFHIQDSKGLLAQGGVPTEGGPPSMIPAGEQQRWQQDHLHLVSQIRSDDGSLTHIAAGFDFSHSMETLRSQNNAMEADEQSLFERMRQMILLTFLALLPLCMISARWLTRHLLRPLHTLTERSMRYAQGERDLSFELSRSDEIGRLGSALEQMRQGLEASHDQVRRMAFEDTVTGLPNRRWFQQRLAEVMHRCGHVDSRFAILFVDLDHFKQVNDTAGHERGDQLLHEVARRLKSGLRERGLQGCQEPLLARLGGDEFVVLLPGIGASEEGAEMARHLAAALARPFLLSGQYFSISCSIGITIYPDDGLSSSEILKHADIAMYAAKQHGRNRFAFFQPSMKEDISERLQIQQGIREAIERDQLYLDYQPIYDMSSGRMVSAEALLRWRHPRQGLISPARFIPIIEESDLIEEVTRWVVQRAMADLKTLLQQDPEFSLSINISGAAVHQLELCERICALKEQHGLPDNSLCIELTETTMIRHLERSETALRRWKAAGIEIWVDDFGTGYSSLAYLNSLSVDGLKIDRSFVHNLVDGHSGPLIDAMVALADSLAIDTVAEGIETEEQYQALKYMGVTFAQGFKLARPMGIDQLLQRLDEEQESSPLPPQRL